MADPEKNDGSLIGDIVEVLLRRKIRVKDEWIIEIAAILFAWLKRHKRAMDGYNASGKRINPQTVRGGTAYRKHAMKAVLEMANKIGEPLPLDDYLDGLALARETYGK